MNARMTVSLHAAHAEDVTASIGYAEGIQSDLTIAGVCIYTQARHTPIEESIRFIRALIEAAEKTETFLLNRRDERNLDADGEPITWDGCGCDFDFVDGRYVANLCNYPPCVMGRDLDPFGINAGLKLTLVGWSK